MTPQIKPGQACAACNQPRVGEQLSHEALGLDASGQLTQVPAPVLTLDPGPTRHARRSPSAAAGKGTGAGRDAHAAAELQRYRKAWVAARHNVAEAARALGLSRAQLAYRLKRGGLL